MNAGHLAAFQEYIFSHKEVGFCFVDDGHHDGTYEIIGKGFDETVSKHVSTIGCSSESVIVSNLQQFCNLAEALR